MHSLLCWNYLEITENNNYENNDTILVHVAIHKFVRVKLHL